MDQTEDVCHGQVVFLSASKPQIFQHYVGCIQVPFQGNVPEPAHVLEVADTRHFPDFPPALLAQHTPDWFAENEIHNQNSKEHRYSGGDAVILLLFFFFVAEIGPYHSHVQRILEITVLDALTGEIAFVQP